MDKYNLFQHDNKFGYAHGIHKSSVGGGPITRKQNCIDPRYTLIVCLEINLKAMGSCFRKWVIDFRITKFVLP